MFLFNVLFYVIFSRPLICPQVRRQEPGSEARRQVQEQGSRRQEQEPGARRRQDPGPGDRRQEKESGDRRQEQESGNRRQGQEQGARSQEQVPVRRRQRVILNGKASEWHEVTASIIQGSTLGPTLAKCFSNSSHQGRNLQPEDKPFLSKFADDEKRCRVV